MKNLSIIIAGEEIKDILDIILGSFSNQVKIIDLSD
jgi:hypothetical protein